MCTRDIFLCSYKDADDIHSFVTHVSHVWSSCEARNLLTGWKRSINAVPRLRTPKLIISVMKLLTGDDSQIRRSCYITYVRHAIVRGYSTWKRPLSSFTFAQSHYALPKCRRSLRVCLQRDNFITIFRVTSEANAMLSIIWNNIIHINGQHFLSRFSYFSNDDNRLIIWVNLNIFFFFNILFTFLLICHLFF